jgi:hypothetical protein
VAPAPGPAPLRLPRRSGRPCRAGEERGTRLDDPAVYPGMGDFDGSGALDGLETWGTKGSETRTCVARREDSRNCVGETDGGLLQFKGAPHRDKESTSAQPSHQGQCREGHARHCGGNSNMESGKGRAAADLAELAVLEQRVERAQGQGQQACPSLSPSRRPMAVVAASLLLLAKPSHIYFLRYCEKEKKESNEKHMVCVCGGGGGSRCSSSCISSSSSSSSCGGLLC